MRTSLVMEKRTPENGFDMDDLDDKPLPSHVLDDIERQDPLHPTFDATIARSKSKPKSKPRTMRPTAYLDGLRGFAAFLVYISHHVSWFYGPKDDILFGYGAGGHKYFAQLPFIRILFTGGSAAVAIFFVLSGYVLSISPLRMVRDGHLQKCYRSLTSAVVRRPFRLYLPPAGVSLVFALCMHLPFGLAPALEWPQPQANLVLELGHLFSELLQLFNPFIPHGISHHWFPYVVPAWTMPIELKGSMLVFFLVAVCSRARPRVRLATFVGLGLVLFHFYQWEMACFMAGIVLAINDLEGLDHAMIPRQVSAFGKSVLHHISFLVGWYLLCQPAGFKDINISFTTPGWYYLTRLTPSRYYNDEFWRFWHNLGAVLLVYGVLRIQWLQRFFTLPLLRYLGQISFSLYLVHQPILWTAGDRIYRIFGMKRQDFDTSWDFRFVVPDVGPHGFTTRFLFSQLFILPLCLIVAEMGTLLLDEPSIKVGKWLVARLGLASDQQPRR